MTHSSVEKSRVSFLYLATFFFTSDGLDYTVISQAAHLRLPKI